ncbi:unnamed protein product [Adineta ricciae]|nr:unnamed protein product [Adineta ricciae]
MFPRISNIHEEFVKSAANNDLRQIKDLLKYRNVNINGIFAGHTALQAAAQNGNLEIVHFLIENRANLEIEDKDGDRAIHHAAFGNEAKILDLLIKSGADINARNKRRQTALHIGVCKNHIDVCKVLLLNGSHLGIQDFQGDTPLHDTISKKHDELTKLLLDSNADVTIRNNEDFNSIHYSVLCGNLTALELILSKIESRQWILNEKKNDGFTCLHLAALNGHFLIVDLLLNKGNVSIDEQNLHLQTALHLAVTRQDLQIVNLICKKNANVNLIDKDGDTCLHEALRHHTLTQLKQLQEEAQNRKMKNIFSNLTNYDKRPSVEISCLLIMSGADLTIKNKKNQTPFDLCSDSHLCRMLTQKNIEYQKKEKRNENFLECLICSDHSRDTIFYPCLHIVTCHSCANRMKKCLLCKEKIQTKTKIEQCKICSKRKASVAYKPCGHFIACENCVDLKKQCLICRQTIDLIVPFKQLCVEKNDIASTKSEVMTGLSNDTMTLASLKQQLEEIREQVHCPICMDRLKDMIFLCGHGVCQNCGNRVKECPICRKQIEKSIILYT